MSIKPQATDSQKFTFSGHESFQCRHLWLKKGYDFVKMKKSFNDEDAVVTINAVSSNFLSSELILSLGIPMHLLRATQPHMHGRAIRFNHCEPTHISNASKRISASIPNAKDLSS